MQIFEKLLNQMAANNENQTSPSAENYSADDNFVSNLPSETDIARHVGQIQKRRLGYNFGGPEKSWCDASLQKGITFFDNPANKNGKSKKFTGCNKYATCNIIPDELRWKEWEKMSDEEKNKLEELRCYRATRGRWDSKKKKITSSDSSGWDIEALPSRKEADESNEWIGNPFGVRTQELGKIAQEVTIKSEANAHRDLAPCSIGGCVTPEMQRDYSKDRQKTDESDDFWKDAEVCPFFYKHTNIDLSAATPNPQRFTQCYVTLPELREHLEKLGLIVVAPVFRTFAGNKANYTYTFYSGLSFLQLPTRSPEIGNIGWLDSTLPLKWQATAAMRSQTTEEPDHLPIGKLFEDAEQGRVLAPWEREARIISVSEGQSTAILLQWVLMRRMLALTESERAVMDVCGEITWNFDNDGILRKLREWGYDTRRVVNIDDEGKAKTTLYQDLQMLGLFDSDTAKPTERLKSCVAWLCARYDENSKINTADGYRNLLQTWLIPQDKLPEDLKPQNFDFLNGNSEDLLWKICWLFVLSAIKEKTAIDSASNFTKDGLSKIQIKDYENLKKNLNKFETENFTEVCRLIPPLHAIVRAKWKKPLRWLFVPLAEGDFDSQSASTPRLYNGLIIILEDDPELESLPYNSELTVEQDTVLNRLRLALPLLTAVSDIEEGYVRYAFDFHARNQDQLIRIDISPAFPGFVIASEASEKIWEKIKNVSKFSSTTVLITGESGTGKELVARAIHDETPSRKDKPFVAVNCSWKDDDNLIASELFGYKKGAFTGAEKDKDGLFKEAEGGTIFLDEIGEMSLSNQAKLLRALQEHKIRPVGGNTEEPFNIRVIAATNREPKKAISEGQLREDLYYRLFRYGIDLPPLRERKGEIAELARHFIKKILEANSNNDYIKSVEISDEAIKVLENYSWGGNVRELENIIEATLIELNDEIKILPEHLPLYLFTSQSDISSSQKIETQIAQIGNENFFNTTNGNLTEIKSELKQISGDKQGGIKSFENVVKKYQNQDTSVSELLWKTLCAAIYEISKHHKKQPDQFARKLGGLLLEMTQETTHFGKPFLSITVLDILAKYVGFEAFPESATFNPIQLGPPESNQSNFRTWDLRDALAKIIQEKLKEVENK